MLATESLAFGNVLCDPAGIDCEPVLYERLGVIDVKPLAITRRRPFIRHIAHYGEFVQWERRKANGQFGAKRTVVSVMPSGVEQR
jgi:hypothetical protein